MRKRSEYHPSNRPDIYIKTFDTTSERSNPETLSTTYEIDGQYSLEGKPWEECQIIWNDENENIDINSNNRYPTFNKKLIKGYLKEDKRRFKFTDDMAKVTVNIYDKVSSKRENLVRKMIEVGAFYCIWCEIDLSSWKEKTENFKSSLNQLFVTNQDEINTKIEFLKFNTVLIDVCSLDGCTPTEDELKCAFQEIDKIMHVGWENYSAGLEIEQFIREFGISLKQLDFNIPSLIKHLNSNKRVTFKNMDLNDRIDEKRMKEELKKEISCCEDDIIELYENNIDLFMKICFYHMDLFIKSFREEE